MRRCVCFAAPALFAAVLGQGAAARASVIVSGTISSQQVGPDSYTYSLTLTLDPASTETVSCFWFASIPEYDLLPSDPTAFTAPAGWTGFNAPDKYGVASAEWTTLTDALNPGQTLAGFSFTTPDPPSAIIGAISPYLDLPVEESYVYRYSDARGDYDEFVPTTVAVPEPAPLFCSWECRQHF